MSLRVYDPKDVFIVFGPAGSLRGFGSGTFIGVSKKSNSYASFAGVDGAYDRSRNSDQGAFSGGGLVSLTASKTLELYFKGTSDDTNLTIGECSFYMKRLQ